ncbi:Ubiquinone biosynthesis protein [Phlyctochytrium planicorne]|nr:Ubiquinone biosynthesis protein [Phlyctochytrium planicorne]
MVRPAFDPIYKRLPIAIKSALTAFADPTRQDMIAALGETTGSFVLERMRDQMLLDATGRKILRERPEINSSTLDLEALRKQRLGTLGREYVNYLDYHNVSPDTRTEVKYIYNDELAYVMKRYRQVHDFWHTVTGLGISVEEEIAVKWLELHQTGLPMTFLSAFVGPLRLDSATRERLFERLVPWAVQCGGSSVFFMNVYYERLLDKSVEDVRKLLRLPTISASAL